MPKYNIQRFKSSVTIAAEGTTIDSSAIPLNGKLLGVLVDVPALVGTTTLTFTLKDSEGYTIFTKASIAEGAKYAQFVDANNHPLELPLSGNCVVTATASNAQTGQAAVIPFVLLIDRG